MNEQLNGERAPSLENTEEKRYEELRTAMAEENRIMEEIEGVLTGVPDREEAEKIVLKQYAPLMEEAMKKSTEAFREWRESARKIGGSA